MQEGEQILHLPEETELARTCADVLETWDGLTEIRETGPSNRALDRLDGPRTVGVLLGDGAPRVDTVSFVRAVRDEHPDLPLLLYGSEERVDPAAAVDAGVTDVIQQGTGGVSPALIETRLRNTVVRYRDERRTERRYQRLVEKSSDMIVVLDGSGTFEYVSPAVETEFGYEPSDLVGEDITDYVHPDDIERALERLGSLVGTPGGHETVEVRFDADGEWRWVEAYGRNLMEDPDVGGIVVHGRDITERRRREERLELFEQVVETVNDGIHAVDVSGRYTYVNDRFVEMTGYTREELLGSDPRDLFPDAPNEEFEAAMREMLRGDLEQYFTEIDIETKDGEACPLEVNITPLGSDGTYRGAVGVARDVSERREREETLNALHRATQELIAASDTETVAELAVETARSVMNQPLSGIFEHDEAASALVPVSTTDESKEVVGDPPTFSEGEGLVWKVFERGGVEVYEEVGQEPGRYNPDTPIGSEIIASVGDFGVMMFGSTDPQGFDEFDVTLAKLLSETVEGSLKRAARESELQTKRRELQRRNDRIEALHDVAKRMKTADDVSEVYSITIDAAERILEFDASLITERDGDKLVTTALVGSDEDGYYETTPLDREDNLAVETFTEGEMILSDDLQADGYAPANSEYRSAISVPLGDWGVFQTVSERPGTFDASDRQLAELLLEHTVASVTRLDRERELKRRAAALERQNERLDSFASMVSHDLRNPMDVIRGRLALARKSADEEHLEAIEGALERMDELIEELLLLAQRPDEQRDRVELDIGAVARVVWGRIDTGSARLELDEPPTVRMNQQHLRQLLTNLFENSLEHGGEVSTVTVGGTENGFYVSDDGTGIAPEERGEVFEFGRSLEDGTGIGLAIVEMIAEAHDYGVTVTDSEAGGARFEFQPLRNARTRVTLSERGT